MEQPHLKTKKFEWLDVSHCKTVGDITDISCSTDVLHHWNTGQVYCKQNLFHRSSHWDGCSVFVVGIVKPIPREMAILEAMIHLQVSMTGLGHLMQKFPAIIASRSDVERLVLQPEL